MIKKLIKNLRKDKDEGSLYYAWQSNIAMPIVDRIKKESIIMYRNNEGMSYEDIRVFANKCAIDFLEILIRDTKNTEDGTLGCEILRCGKKSSESCLCNSEMDSDSVLKVEAIRLAIEICREGMHREQMYVDTSYMYTDNIIRVAQQTYNFLIEKRKETKC